MLKIKDLTFSYPHQQKIFKDFCLEIEDSGIYAICGDNGNGKTTLLKLLAGLLHAQHGRIECPSTKSYLAQKTPKPEGISLTALEYINLSRINEKQGPKSLNSEDSRSLEILNKLGLEKYIHQSIQSMSGGEFQRLL